VLLGVRQKLMGHADVATTMRYVDVSDDDKRDAIATVSGAFESPGGSNATGTRVEGAELHRRILVTPLGLEPKFSA
jgi:hypothetical protein